MADKRLIDADSYGKRLASWKLDCIGHDDWETASAIDDCLCELDAQPTVDTVEVVHGRWEEKQEPIPWCEDDVDVFTVCSVCGACTPGESNYCPNCGAKMDGGAEDGMDD